MLGGQILAGQIGWTYWLVGYLRWFSFFLCTSKDRYNVLWCPLVNGETDEVNDEWWDYIICLLRVMIKQR